jgi:selenocysteine-specific elongation factor
MRSVVVGTAGHIDHGKSTLVRALTGIDPDRLKEEKDRGITIDLGFAHATIDGIRVAFVDVPGHERFVRNMLAGIGGIDLVLLVVAADESVMPQTREHFEICKLLEIPAGVVALTKADLADADTLELTRLEVRELVAGSFLEKAPMVAVSARTGAGLDDLRRALHEAAMRTRTRSAAGPVRLPIDRVFSVKGFGTVVTGTLVSGCIRPDDRLVVLPHASGGRVVTVRGVQVHGTRQDEASAGQRAAVNLAGVEVAELSRGESLAVPGAFEATRVADAVLELLSGTRPLRHGARVRFHQGTAEIMGRIAVIGPPPDTGAPMVQPGARAFVRLRLEQAAVLARGDRYILRAYSPSVTIGGGTILDPAPPRRAIRTAAAAARCRRLAANDPSGITAAAVMVEDAARRGFALAALTSRAGIAPAAIEAAVAALAASHAIDHAGDVLVARRIVDDARAALLALLERHHQTQPLSEGVPRDEARERVLRRGHPAVFERAVDDLVAAGRIVARDRLALAGHRVELSPEEQRARDAIERVLKNAGLTPPDLAALCAQAGVKPSVGDQVVRLLQKEKRLIRIDTLFFHDEALTRLKEQVAALKEQRPGATIDVAGFKERFGVTRKFAIPLLEYLDRERVTRRVGDARLIL